MALAGIADKVLGGGHVADLKSRGQSKGFAGVGAGYSPVAYTQDEANEIVSEMLEKYQMMTAPPDASNSSSDVPPGVAPGDFEQVPVK
jgi:hypothetical protein